MAWCPDREVEARCPGTSKSMLFSYLYIYTLYIYFTGTLAKVAADRSTKVSRPLSQGNYANKAASKDEVVGELVGREGILERYLSVRLLKKT